MKIRNVDRRTLAVLLSTDDVNSDYILLLLCFSNLYDVDRIAIGVPLSTNSAKIRIRCLESDTFFDSRSTERFSVYLYVCLQNTTKNSPERPKLFTCLSKNLYFDSVSLDSLNSRKHTTYVLVRLKRNRPSSEICSVVGRKLGGLPKTSLYYFDGIKTTTAHLLAKLEAENKTQECKIFYIFIISSFQLKSLGQTKLLLCLCDGFLSSKPRSTTKLDNLTSRRAFERSNLARLKRNLTTPKRMIIHGQADILILILSLEASEPFTSTCRYIPLLTLSLEAYKESRQKRLVVKHRKNNLKTAILQYFLDTAANTTILHYFGNVSLDSPSSKKHTMYIYVNVFPFTSSLPCPTLALVSKESRQKSWGDKNDMYKIKNAILCTLCSVLTSFYTTWMNANASTNLDSLTSKLARPLTAERRFGWSFLARLDRNFTQTRTDDRRFKRLNLPCLSMYLTIKSAATKNKNLKKVNRPEKNFTLSDNRHNLAYIYILNRNRLIISCIGENVLFGAITHLIYIITTRNRTLIVLSKEPVSYTHLTLPTTPYV